jgi:hypothetical protein
MFLLNPALWNSLGPRRVWLSIGIGYEGGRHHRRHAHTVDPLPQGSVTKIYIRWTDNRAQVKCSPVPIRHLHPTPPTACGKEGIVLFGAHRGKLITVVRYLKKHKVLHVRNAAEEWEEPEDNVCWVEQIDGI